jgi:hypothetical protein
MSAFGTKRTWACAQHMSAFGGKADITSELSANDLKRSLEPMPREQGHASDFHLKTARVRMTPTQSG